MRGVAMHSCVTTKAPRDVDRRLALASAGTPSPRSTKAAARATNAATASTAALSRYHGESAVKTTTSPAVDHTNRAGSPPVRGESTAATGGPPGGAHLASAIRIQVNT